MENIYVLIWKRKEVYINKWMKKWSYIKNYSVETKKVNEKQKDNNIYAHISTNRIYKEKRIVAYI